MARLDRLSSVRRVAQIGAAIGRQFPYPLLQAVSRLDEDELQASGAVSSSIRGAERRHHAHAAAMRGAPTQ
jgi:hypothetical protein